MNINILSIILYFVKYGASNISQIKLLISSGIIELVKSII